MEPWNLRTDDSRSANSLTTFIIFCEGDISEPLYFKYFETPVIKVNPIPGQNSKLKNVQKAMEHCYVNKLFVYQNGLPFWGDQTIKLWCAYDRDTDWTTEEKIISGNLLFDNSIHAAEKNGLKIAWSNDSFELWVLLHFEDVDPTIKENSQRMHYYSRLTEILKSFKGQNSELDKLLQIPNFAYKVHCKGRDNFLNIVRKLIMPLTNHAIRRAKTLHEYHSNPIKPPHQMAPHTLVFKLVEELIVAGGKEIPKTATLDEQNS